MPQRRSRYLVLFATRRHRMLAKIIWPHGCGGGEGVLEHQQGSRAPMALVCYCMVRMVSIALCIKDDEKRGCKSGTPSTGLLPPDLHLHRNYYGVPPFALLPASRRLKLFVNLRTLLDSMMGIG